MTTGYETQPNPAWPAPTPAPPAPAAQLGRPGWVTTAAVLLLVVGALSAFGGMLMLILGLAFGSEWTELMALESGTPDTVAPEAVAGMMTGVLVVIAVLALAWAAGHVAAGVGILGGRGWARITGMVLSVIGLVFSLLLIGLTVASFGMTASLMEDPEFRELYGPGYAEDLMGTSIITSFLFLLPWLIGYIVVLVVLIRTGAFFNRPRTTVSQPT